MKITFLGAAHEVTGSCTLLQINDKNILIDCGLEQGANLYENCELPVTPGGIDMILLTHAHIDHSGKIPYMSAGGFKGEIYATAATVKLCEIMLMDSAHIQEFEANWRNRKAKRSGKEMFTPFYTTADAMNSLKLFNACGYNKEYKVCKGVKIRFIDAGHLLGSSSIELTATENGVTKTIVFSGDIGNVSRPLINDPGQPEKSDYIVIESTYGTRFHGERPDYVSQLTSVIQETLDKGGNVVIPAFAVGRTQELLYLIRVIKEKGLVHGHDGFPVYVDSPLAVEATDIYSHSMHEFYDKDTLALLEKGINPIKFSDLKLSITSDDSIAINQDTTPKVIISSSGMCEAGRIRHHLKHNLWRANSTILFVGYQSAGTIGRLLTEDAETVKLFGEEIQVNASIKQLEGISGHGDQKILLDWLRGFTKKPEFIFTNHGDDQACDEFAGVIESELNIKAAAPYNGAQYDLLTGECLVKGNTIRLERTADKGKEKEFRPSVIFVRLLSAGQRLQKVIEQYRYGANKDVAKFADQLTSLTDKWDK